MFCKLGENLLPPVGHVQNVSGLDRKYCHLLPFNCWNRCELWWNPELCIVTHILLSMDKTWCDCKAKYKYSLTIYHKHKLKFNYLKESLHSVAHGMRHWEVKLYWSKYQSPSVTHKWDRDSLTTIVLLTLFYVVRYNNLHSKCSPCSSYSLPEIYG